MDDDVFAGVPREVSLVTLGLDVPRSTVASTSHPWHELLYVLRGTYVSRIAGTLTRLEPGQLLHLPAGTVHRSAHQRDRSVQIFVLTVDEAEFGSTVFVTRDANGRVLALLQWLRDTFPRSTGADIVLHRSLVTALARELRDLQEIAVASADPVNRAQEFFRRNYSRTTLTLTEVCEVVGLTPATFERRFRAATGTAPMAWLQELRTRRAFELLRSSRQPIGDIARAVGFKSVSYFSRLMRREFGRPPRELRSDHDTD